MFMIREALENDFNAHDVADKLSLIAAEKIYRNKFRFYQDFVIHEKSPLKC